MKYIDVIYRILYLRHHHFMVIGFLRAGGRKKVHKLRQFDSEFTSNTFTHREEDF